MRFEELEEPLAAWVAELQHASGTILGDVLDALTRGASSAGFLDDAEGVLRELAGECEAHLKRIAELRACVTERPPAGLHGCTDAVRVQG